MQGPCLSLVLGASGDGSPWRDCEVDFPDSPPLPLCSICLFNPSHYPGPSLGSAPLLEMRSSSIDRGRGASEAWLLQRGGSLPEVSTQPGAPATAGGGDKGPALPTYAGGASWPRHQPPGKTPGPRTQFLQVFPKQARAPPQSEPCPVL